jgi:hypothetical protein
MTTLSNVVVAAGDQIVFNNATTEVLAGTSAVNVTSAGSSLAKALDIAAADTAASQAGGQIAAHTGVIAWFQLGSDQLHRYGSGPQRAHRNRRSDQDQRPGRSQRRKLVWSYADALIRPTRRSANARRTGRGNKGAKMRHPGWGGNSIGFLPFPAT